MLHIPYGLSAHTMAQEVDFVYFIPATRHSIRKSKYLFVYPGFGLRASQLFEVLGDIDVLMQMILVVMLMAIYCSSKIRSNIICRQPMFLPKIIYPNELLIQFTRLIMRSSIWRHIDHVYVIIRLAPSF